MLLDTNSSFNLIRFIKKYTIGLFLKNDIELKNNEILKGYNFISQEEFDLVDDFKEQFSIVSK